MNVCIVVPHYDHLDQFRRFLPELADVGIPLIVVDDASTAAVAESLSELLEGIDVEASLIRHSSNRGKGGAVMTGLRAAYAQGYSHALQIDADGQHDCSDIAAFIDAGTDRQHKVICGEPVFDNSISSLRYYARYITKSFNYLETLSFEVRDALCGFRLYPLATIVPIIDNSRLGERMTFDPELLVRAVWAGIGLHYVPVNVIYPEDGRSHFHYLRDNIQISWMHTCLLLGMLVRLPMLLKRKIQNRHEVSRP